MYRYHANNEKKNGNVFLEIVYIDYTLQGSSQKKEGVVLRSKHSWGFSDHIKEILPQKGLFPALARSF